MMGPLRYMAGEVRLKITGASPQRCLNLLTQKKIDFWDITRGDELHYFISVAPNCVTRVQGLSLRAFCTVEEEKRRGFLQTFRAALRRPILLFGLILVLTVSFLLPSFVWSIEIDGNSRLHDEEILRLLEQESIKIGTPAGSVDYKAVKYRLMTRLDDISWLAINRCGGTLHVLITERDHPTSEKPSYVAGNIVAASDGVLTEVTVLEGMRLCKVGDTVKAGQILVSGLEDYGLCPRAVCAQAEIYAQTWHQTTLVSPATTLQKQYTGREWTQQTLIVGRKRINLYGNSGNVDGTCDKIVKMVPLQLPGYEFPITLETAYYREYTTTAVPSERTGAQMESAFERLLLKRLVAGQIVSKECSLRRTDDLLILTAQATCTEMLARLVPLEPIYEGETNE